MNILDKLVTNSFEKGLEVDLDMLKSAFATDTSETVELADLIENSLSDLFTVLFSSDPSVYQNNEDLLPHFKKEGRRGGYNKI